MAIRFIPAVGMTNHLNDLSSRNPVSGDEGSSSTYTP